MNAPPVPAAQRLPLPAMAPPASLEATGVSKALLLELVLKHLQRGGDASMAELGASVALPLPVLDRLLGFLREEQYIEVPRRGSFDAEVRYALTGPGRARAEEAMRRNQYAGPAPVSLPHYVAQVERQRVTGARIGPGRVDEALRSLVLPSDLVATLGAAINSLRPLFLYGASGTGKTWLAEHLVQAIEGAILVPHAIEVDGEIIQVFDEVVHRRVDVAERTGSLDRAPQPDARWVLCHRPVIKLGGELTLAMMDLERDAVTRFYKAPAQLRANNGALVFDDLGRQRSPAHQILNRWIVPLDRHVDHFSLHTGTSFQVPFDVLLVFSSNLSPASLDDPAFVRRLGYKVRLDALDEASYRQVFRRACQRAGVEFDEVAEDFLVRELHARSGMPLFPAYPLDLVLMVRDRAVYENRVAKLTPEALRWAWALYFAAESGEDGYLPTIAHTADVAGVVGQCASGTDTDQGRGAR